MDAAGSPTCSTSYPRAASAGPLRKWEVEGPTHVSGWQGEEDDEEVVQIFFIKDDAKGKPETLVHASQGWMDRDSEDEASSSKDDASWLSRLQAARVSSGSDKVEAGLGDVSTVSFFADRVTADVEDCSTRLAGVSLPQARLSNASRVAAECQSSPLFAKSASADTPSVSQSPRMRSASCTGTPQPQEEKDACSLRSGAKAPPSSNMKRFGKTLYLDVKGCNYPRRSQSQASPSHVHSHHPPSPGHPLPSPPTPLTFDRVSSFGSSASASSPGSTPGVFGSLASFSPHSPSLMTSPSPRVPPSPSQMAPSQKLPPRIPPSPKPPRHSRKMSLEGVDPRLVQACSGSQGHEFSKSLSLTSSELSEASRRRRSEAATALGRVPEAASSTEGRAPISPGGRRVGQSVARTPEANRIRPQGPLLPASASPPFPSSSSVPLPSKKDFASLRRQRPSSFSSLPPPSPKVPCSGPTPAASSADDLSMLPPQHVSGHQVGEKGTCKALISQDSSFEKNALLPEAGIRPPAESTWDGASCKQENHGVGPAPKANRKLHSRSTTLSADFVGRASGQPDVDVNGSEVGKGSGKSAAISPRPILMGESKSRRTRSLSRRVSFDETVDVLVFF